MNLSRRVFLLATAAAAADPLTGQHAAISPMANTWQQLISRQEKGEAYGLQKPVPREDRGVPLQNSYVDGFMFGEHALATCIEREFDRSHLVTMYGDNIVLRARVNCNAGACELIAGSAYKKSFRPVQGAMIHESILQVNDKKNWTKLYERDIDLARPQTRAFHDIFLDIVMQKYAGTLQSMKEYKSARDSLLRRTG